MTKQDDEFDLLLRVGRMVCPARALDMPGAIAVRGDRIAAVGAPTEAPARETLDFPDAILLPGLIDLHAHPACESPADGLAPDTAMLPRGVTTVGSQGDAGATNWPWYRDTTISGSRTRVRLAINIGGRGEQTKGGACENLADIDVEACVAAIEDGRDWIWGVAVNASTHACGSSDPRAVVARALEAAKRTSLPLLYGPRVPEDWAFEEQLALLRPCDVVTYFCRGKPYSLFLDGRVLPAVREARQRGILFDAVHGMGSFSFPVAEAAVADGCLPDTISTDLYAGRDGAIPPHNLPQVMSKFFAAGMREAAIFSAVTDRPARILGLEAEIGSLTVGACADLTVLKWNEASVPLVDVDGVERAGGCWETVLTVRAGTIVNG